MSLRLRIALLVGVTVLVASAIGGVGTAVSSRNVGRDRIDQALTADAAVFREQSPRLAGQVQFAFEARRANCDDVDPDADELEVESRRTRDRLQNLPEFASSLQLIRPTGRVVAACRPLPVSDTEIELAELGQGTITRTVTLEGERFRVLTRGFEEIGAVQFSRSLQITDDTVRGLLGRSFGFGLVGAVLASMLGWLLARRATAPLEDLSEAADRIARTNDLGERIEPAGSGEIAALADSFNTMLASLDTSREQQRRLVQDASHELRTPLTSMRTNVELLQRHTAMDAAMRAEVLADIGAELGELTDLTTELVDSAIEVPTTVDLSREIDLPGLVHSCVERAERRHRRAISVIDRTVVDDVRVTDRTVVNDVRVTGDAALLARAVTNLVNNAVKFSPDDSEIEVDVSATEVLVRDRGRGVAAQDLPHVFDRFYRSSEARSETGSGLGLAIVRQIVLGHGGHVVARNRPDGGAEFGFSLPPLRQDPAAHPADADNDPH